jgi:hypothetical protein
MNERCPMTLTLPAQWLLQREIDSGEYVSVATKESLERVTRRGSVAS